MVVVVVVDDDYTGGFGERPPAALAVRTDVVDEALVLFLSPGSFVRVSFLAT
ncbi:hypothetical protein U1Q18_036949, partial [Sarracenia purpurea var. burkii]